MRALNLAGIRKAEAVRESARKNTENRWNDDHWIAEVQKIVDGYLLEGKEDLVSGEYIEVALPFIRKDNPIYKKIEEALKTRGYKCKWNGLGHQEARLKILW